MAKNSRNSSETKAKNRVSDNMQDAYDTRSRNKMTDKESERSENTWEKDSKNCTKSCYTEEEKNPGMPAGITPAGVSALKKQRACIR